MDDLLNKAVAAHGGLARWRQLSTLRANMSITGAIWPAKNQPDALVNIRVETQLHSQHVLIHQVQRKRKLIFTPQRVAMETESGEVLGSRDNPRRAFAGQTQFSPWDDLHLAYFCGYALWTYLTTPFLYTNPGFLAKEIQPWDEDGQRWRVLHVAFPEHIVSHSHLQSSYVGDDGLLRRHEYSVDVMGGAHGLNYASDYRDFDGIMVPTKRRIYASDDRKQKIPAPLLIAIDIDDVTFA
ncbi:MAG: hypothetical protein JWP25_7126 [Bradyrhizobium sp.]|nr:hypothetical protein [Bradyrhizobium sp.]